MRKNNPINWRMVFLSALSIQIIVFCSTLIILAFISYQSNSGKSTDTSLEDIRSIWSPLLTILITYLITAVVSRRFTANAKSQARFIGLFSALFAFIIHFSYGQPSLPMNLIFSPAVIVAGLIGGLHSGRHLNLR